MAKEFNQYKLPENWIWVELGDILETTSGGTPSRSRPDYYNGTIPWVKSGELNYNIITKTEEQITDVALQSSSAKLFPKGTLLIALYGATVGRLAFLGIDASTNQAVCGISQNSNINIKYIYYCLMNQYSYLISLSAGGAQPNISQTIIRKVNIPLAPFNEQNRIVDKLDELLSELEKGKEQLRISLEQLKVFRQSILKHAFEGKLSEEWRTKQSKLKTPDELLAEIKEYRKLKYERQLKEYKVGKLKVKPKEPKEISLPTKSELAVKPELPKGWFYIFLKDISEVVERVNLKEKKTTESFLYLDIGGINNDKNVIESHKEYKWKDAPSRAQQIVKTNDILFSTVRTYMKNIAMVEDEKFSNQVASSGFTVIRALKGIVNSNFLFKQLLSDVFIQPLNDLQTGSSYPAVRDTDVFNQIVPVCSIEEQIFVTQELDEKYSNVQNLEETINQNLFQSESLRQALLQKAFEGKLVEQNPVDEPASILLERIKTEREEYLKAEKEKKIIQKKPMKKKSDAKVSEFPLLNTIKDKFGKDSFTFDQLKSEVDISYDDLREELFSLLDNEKLLAMEFDQKKESMNFKYVGK